MRLRGVLQARLVLVEQRLQLCGQKFLESGIDDILPLQQFDGITSLDLAEIPLVHFNGTNYLQSLSGNAYSANAESGAAIAGASGSIDGSSLEGSNTDIADEFTKLIVTQQAYSANTKVITTANDMVQDLLAVLR